MFAWLGGNAWRSPWLWIAGWAALAATLHGIGPTPAQLAQIEPRSLMADDERYNQALRVERESFPDVASRTRTVLVFAHNPALTTEDHAYLARLTARLAQESAERHWQVRSPISQPFLRPRLLSSDGQAAMIIVGLDINYVTDRCRREVGLIERLARKDLPAGSQLEITGEGGMGRDLSDASDRAYRRTTWVTVGVLLVILALVYRSPLAALLPLIAVGISVFTAMAALNLLALSGWSISGMEKSFVVVLLFGSGIDFSLFWMWRYREALSSTLPRREAFVLASAATGPAVAASAATTVCGFLMLTFAELLPSHNAGRALSVALLVAFAAAVTLVPATARLVGSALFWPRKSETVNDPQSRLWAPAANLVGRRPGMVIVGVMLLLAVPVWGGLCVEYEYDAFGVIPQASGTARGRALAEEHFGASGLFGWTILIESAELRKATPALAESGRQLADQLAVVPGITDVWSLGNPLGRSAGLLGQTASLAGPAIGKFYLNSESGFMRLELMMEHPPLSREAMRCCEQIQAAAQSWIDAMLHGVGRIHATGLTPYIMNIRTLADADQGRVMLFATMTIALLVFIWSRRIGLSLFMVSSTLLVYAAALGMTDFFFAGILGWPGIDWKVQLFLFVVLVAVGQDYNIFIVSRIRQECLDHSPTTAVKNAIIHTGSVISSCGLIMAATLVSLAATGLPLLQELGFAFATGILLDTFVVRPLFVPAFFLLAERARGRTDSGT